MTKGYREHLRKKAAEGDLSALLQLVRDKETPENERAEYQEQADDIIREEKVLNRALDMSSNLYRFKEGQRRKG